VLFRANAATWCGANVALTGAVGWLANRSPDDAVAPRSSRRGCPVGCYLVGIQAQYKEVDRSVVLQKDPNMQTTSLTRGLMLAGDV
jgi:hypothetical protein